MGPAGRKSEVIQKDLDQWYLKITQYADNLSRLNNLDQWQPCQKPCRKLDRQSYGVEIFFKVKETEDKIAVFTTRRIHFWRHVQSFLLPEHPLVTHNCWSA